MSIDASAPTGRGGAGAAALAALGHLLLPGLLLFPVLSDPLGRVAGSGQVDVWNHAWGPWWWWQALSRGELPWRTDLLNWPLGGVLWFIDPLLAAVGAPLVPLLGLAGAWNAALWLHLSFASVAASAFARQLGAGRPAAWVASAGVVGSAWVACELHNGISEGALVGPVLLALAATERAVQQRTWSAWALAGAAAGLSALASPYLGLGTGLALLLRGLPHVRRAWVGALVAFALALPPTLVMRAQFAASDAIVRRPSGMNEQLALHNAVDPRTFVAPFGFRSVDLSAEDMQHSMYLGLGLLALAAAGISSAPRRGLPWLAAALLCAVLALGPWLYWGGGWVTTSGGLRLALPWSALQALVPQLAVTHPLRLAVPALGVIAGLAALGAHRLLGRRAWLLAPLVAFDGLVIGGATWPLETAAARPPAVYSALVPAPGRRQAVLDLPTDAGSTMATSRYLFWQGHHGLPIPYAVDARASTSPLLAEDAFRTLAALRAREGIPVG